MCVYVYSLTLPRLLRLRDIMSSAPLRYQFLCYNAFRRRRRLRLGRLSRCSHYAYEGIPKKFTAGYLGFVDFC